jgi:hypothetical protein
MPQTWIFKALSILEFHLDKCKNYSGIRGDRWRVEDTASELKLSVGYVSESLKLAKAFPRYEGRFDKMTREGALRLIKEGL